VDGRWLEVGREADGGLADLVCVDMRVRWHYNCLNECSELRLDFLLRII